MRKINILKHPLSGEQKIMQKLKLSTLAASITLVIAQSASTYASDIEIYTKPSATASSGVVVMMLDTSGSMDVSVVGSSACDFPESATNKKYTNNSSYRETLPSSAGGYSRRFCTADIRTFYFKQIPKKDCGRWDPWCTPVPTEQWYSCGVEGTFNKNLCTTLISKPNINDYTKDSENYYFREEKNKKIYDRMSRLKDALYTLATMPVYDEETEVGIKADVKIGIGTFPYVGGNENNLRGYIRIPAETWGPVGSTQRKKVLDLIKNSSFNGTGGTPTSAAYAEAAAYLLGTTTGGGNYSGINLSKAVDSSLVSGANYVSPLDKSAGAAECSGQGIYFLTDGQPQSPKDTDNSVLMGKALGLNSYNKTSSLTGGANEGGTYRAFWSQIGAFSQSLNDVDIVKKALGVSEAKREVLTAVVGFGSVFDGDYTDMNQDAKNAYDWGLLAEDGGSYGQGGFIAARESDEVVKSLNEFIGKVGGAIPSISTGSSTIPLDALNPEIIQPYSYFPQFEPKVDDDAKQQLWFGNLKKFHVVNNGVFADENGTKKVVVEVNKKSRLQDVRDIWANGTISQGDSIYAKYGALNKMPLGTTISADSTIAGRNLLTDYEFDSTESAGNQIKQNLGLVRITHQYTTDAKTKTDNANRIKGLMGLLGYNISNANQDLVNEPANMRQMGSLLHSLPVLLTQEGEAVAKLNADKKVVIDTESRKDYVLFGTTQGLLHVVDAETGVEKFSFLPKEMAEKQYELFKYGAGTWDHGKDGLYYGVDGEWAAHTVYVSKDDGTLTVDGAVRNVAGGNENEKENLQGKQWVYGGLRMGGRSYYALDLTGLSDSNSYKPKIKFHIDPTTGTVRKSKVNKDGSIDLSIKHYPAIGNMGQSWSKPKLDYVNWNGKRKLVMFVGGGYDAGGLNGDGTYDDKGVRNGYGGYEKYNYRQDLDAKNEIGSGVYMFDADNGDLLWYASKTKHTEVDTADINYLQPDKYTKNDNLKYSVVSEIKTVDRNNDGIVDHLYFGDLAGQAFRVDLNKPNIDKTGFTFEPQVTRILNLNNSNGKSPRFYLPPVFTAHHSAGKTEGGNIVMATFISGNKSSPLLGTSESPQKDVTGLAMDAVYGIYQYDILPTGEYYPDNSASDSKNKDKILSLDTLKPELKQLMPLTTITNNKNATTMLGAKISATDGWGGWYYKLNKNIEDGVETAGIVKGITPLVAMEGNLYATLYDSSEAGSTETCGAGVKGNSFTQRLCLPTGVCQEQANFKYNLGSGIVSLNVGPMSSNKGNKGIIIPDPTREENIKCIGADCPTAGNRFIPAGGALKFIPHRWYERYSTKGQ
ncbi:MULTISPECIES: hypothetical protein [Acinetobacter]|uniref:hypothetical protein n=1 Tax=Acinetobacter TaxID=469 RepID=UPI0015D34F10|nr:MULTISPECIES: hypothetical protein [Acinetobacter]MCP0911164.1 hypothetical protein [Acinetobacter pseudolwoffii]